jgi:hypothetical protein
MERRAPLGFSLDALIAEAKRRARQRRVLVVLLLVVVAGVTAAVVLRPSGGGSRSGSLSGRVGSTSASSHSARFGAFVLTVPKGFHQVETRQSRQSPALHSITIADDSLTARAVSHGLTSPANGVVLLVENFGSTAPGSAPRLPFDLHKLRREPDAPFGGGHGTQWSAFLSGGGEAYAVTVFEGSKASAADRAAIERALKSIRRAS